MTLGLVAGFAWGTTFVPARWLTSVHSVTAPVIVLFRFATAAPILWFLYFLLRPKHTPLDRRDIPKIAGLAMLGTITMANLAFLATTFTTNQNVNLIMNSNANFIAVIAAVAGITVTRRQWVGIAAGLLGVIVIGLAGKESGENFTLTSHLAGCAFATAAAVSWALYTVLGTSLVAKYGGLLITCLAVTLGALVQIPIAISSGLTQTIPQLHTPQWLALIYIGIVPTALAFACWFVALNLTDPTSLGVTQYPGIILGLILGHVLLSEAVLPAHYVGGALVLLGTHFAVTTSGRKSPKSRTIS